jgi:hypothetical protein
VDSRLSGRAKGSEELRGQSLNMTYRDNFRGVRSQSGS